jgi:hypothetical protein
MLKELIRRKLWEDAVCWRGGEQNRERYEELLHFALLTNLLSLLFVSNSSDTPPLFVCSQTKKKNP